MIGRDLDTLHTSKTETKPIRSVPCHTVQDAGIALATSVRAAVFPELGLRP